jgi:hypothetical protein
MLSARQHFPGTFGKVFLDAACCSLAPRPAVESIEKFLGLAMVCPLDSSTHHHIFMDEMCAAARPGQSGIEGENTATERADLGIGQVSISEMTVSNNWFLGCCVCRPGLRLSSAFE